MGFTSLPLDDLPALSLDDESERLVYKIRMDLDLNNPFSLMPATELYGKEVNGFKVIGIEDVWKLGQVPYRELVLVEDLNDKRS